MARHYDLNKLRLEVDDDGFTLEGIPNAGRTAVLGKFDEPETITLRFFRKDVIASYISQPEVLSCSMRGDPDALAPEREVVETVFTLKPGVNWFELDHTTFNSVYMGGK